MDFQLDQPFTYILSSKAEGRAISNYIRNLGYTASDGQTRPTDGNCHEITVNLEIRGTCFKRGVFFFNAYSIRLDSEQEAWYTNFWDRNRFLDYCILSLDTASTLPKKLDVHYIIAKPDPDTFSVVRRIQCNPHKKGTPLKNIIRPATSWEINSWLMRRNLLNFSTHYFDMLRQGIKKRKQYD